MSNRLYSVVDKAPFSGKFVIGNSLTKYYTIGDNGKNMQFLRTAGLLTTMVGMHALQAKIGLDNFISHANETIDTQEPEAALWASLDIAYVTAMGATTLRQFDHLTNVTKKHVSWVKKYFSDDHERVEREPRRRKYTKGAIALSLTVTLGGQIAEVASLHDTYDGEQYEQCIDNYEPFLTENGTFRVGAEEKQYVIRDLSSVKTLCDDLT